MKKKFYGALLVGSLFLAGGMVSCSDYDDDINSLNERVDALEKTVAELQKAIEAGAVITNVESTENGVKVTLSDGKTFEVKNGKDGINGADGADGKPGSVVTIDEEGYWCIDGNRVLDKDGKPYKAQGEKGETGEPGEDGKDGCWYMPNEDGYWHKQYYNEEGTVVDEKTENSWTDTIKKDVVTVVYDSENGRLLISNAEGMEEGQVIAIPITSDLKSLAVIPYVLDSKTNLPLVYFYNIMGYESKVEVGNVTADRTVASSTKAKAHFRLNPANADVKAWDWNMINRTVQVRAAGDANDLLSIASYERSNDELIVSLKSNKSLADLDQFTNERAIAALQGVNKETNEVITSDYLRVDSKDLYNFSIISTRSLKPNKYATTIEGLDDKEDLEMVYTESIDLKDYVKTWAEDINPGINPITCIEDIVDEGELTYEFILPETYNKGGNQTNQQKFVTLEGSVLKVNTKDWPNGTGAIGTTPIVEVVAVVNNKVVSAAIIRVSIVEKIQEDKPAYVVTVDPVNMEYNDLNVDDVVAKFTWEDMRKVYDALSITREQFTENYKEVTIDQIPNAVELRNLADEIGDAGDYTNVVEMRMNPAGVASNAEGVVKITFAAEDRKTYAPIVIEFPYTIYHNHKSFPEFNEYFVNKDTKVAEIRGTMVDGKWTMSTELAEHFLLEGYKLENNHDKLFAVLRRDAHVGAELSTKDETNVDSPYDLAKQVLTFTKPIDGEYIDIPVAIIAEKANGELSCVMSYTVRFLNHFEITAVNIPALTENANGTPVEGKVTYTIKERFGEKRALVTNSVVNETLAAEYGLTKDDFTAKYTEGENWATKFGQNINKGDKLTLTDNADGTAKIKWDNAGSALTKNAETTLNLDVTIDGISVVSKTGNSVVVKKVQ